MSSQGCAMSQSQGIEVRPTRRTIARGAAWAVPVVAVSAAAPAFASSPSNCVPIFSFSSGSCKCPGQSSNQHWGYYLGICAEDANNCVPDPEGTNTIWIYAVQNNSGKALIPVDTTFPIEVTLGECTEFFLFGSTSSASSIRFQYSTSSDGSNLQWSSYISAPPDCEESGQGNNRECLPPAGYGA